MVDAVKLSDRYALEDRIARGGMGSVYSAFDERLDRKVAVKLLKDELATQPDFVERFRREARAVAALAHPNIASVYDYGEDDGVPYIVMELLSGRDLAQLLRDEGAMDPERARHIAIQLANALGHAHEAGIVHRDVKPANVILSEDDHVKVTDFGIARIVDDTTLTAAGSVLGTAQYISPEQASGGTVGPPTDVYSAGLVLYEMLTGEPPFTGDTPVAIAMRHVSDDVAPPSAKHPGVPPSLDEVVGRATTKDPQQRYGSGAEMASALHAADADGSGAAVPGVASTATLTAPPDATAVLPAEGPPPRKPTSFATKAIGLAALFVLLLVGGLLAATYIADQGDQTTRRNRAGAEKRQQQADPSPSAEPETVTVPSGLIGSNVDDAQEVLRGQGLEPQRQDVASDEPKDTVIRTDPAEGSEVEPGAVVVLLVSQGPPEEPPADEGDEGHGKAHGHDKDKGNGNDEHGDGKE